MSLAAMVVTAVAFLINSRLGALLLLLAVACFLFTAKGNVYEWLLKVIVYSSAYYTFDLFGGRQRLSVCIVAIAALCVLLTFNMLTRGAIVDVSAACKLIALIVFLGSYGLSVWTSHDSIEMVFVTYHLVLLAYLIFIIPVAKNEELMQTDTDALMKIYIHGVCAVAITLYIQYAAKTVVGISLGEIYEYNSDRVIYNVFFYSKSVLSLYLAVGLLYYFIEYIRYLDQFKLYENQSGLMSYAERAVRKAVNILERSYCSRLELSTFEGGERRREDSVIVSMTTFPARIGYVHLAIKSLLSQTVIPEKLILWLAKDQFRDVAIPEQLRALCAYGLEIRFCDEDLLAHKKYYYAMRTFPEQVIVTYDDDIIYPEDSLEKLLMMHRKFPDAIICNRGREIEMNGGFVATYKDWKVSGRVPAGLPSYRVMASTGAGTLYPPHCILGCHALFVVVTHHAFYSVFQFHVVLLESFS